MTQTAIMVKVNISPATDPKYDMLKDQIVGLTKSIAMLPVETEEDVGKVNTEVNIGRKLSSQIESLRKEYKNPLIQYGRQIDQAFKELSDPIAAAEKVAKDKVLAFHKVQAEAAERIRQENLRKIREQAEMQRLIDEENERLRQEQTVDQETGEVTGPELMGPEPEPELVAPVSVLEKVASDHGSSTVKMVGKWKVADFAKVPDTYKIINEKMINNMVRDGCREIPGVEIWEEPDVSFRAKGGRG